MTQPKKWGFGLLTITLCAACSEPSPSTEPRENQPPVANIGINQIALQRSTVTVFGGRSTDPDNNNLSYTWRLNARPEESAATLSTNGDTTTFIADLTGRYRVSLSVNDGQVSSATVSVDINVIADRSLADEGSSAGMWPFYAGDLSSSKYSPLRRITPDNVANLEVVWRWRSPDNDLPQFTNFVFEPTPLMIDGVLYTSTSFSQVAAINGETGETLWIYDPKSYNSGRPPNNGFTHRGLSYDEKRGEKRIYMPTGDGRLIALNAVSGRPIETFGSVGDGTVNLLNGIPRLNASTIRLGGVHNLPGSPVEEIDPNTVVQVGNTSPGVICHDVIVMGSSVHDGEILPPSPPGDVRAYHIVTGEHMWTFHTIPRENEFGVETWENESWRTNGNTNVWAPMSADETLGLVYLPVSGATNNYYGGRRLGDNLFTNSVVALDCATGERRWHYQTLHHDIWDYDLPAAPNLIDITVDGKPIKALAQVSKQGFVYVLNRETGEPVWPIIETPVPASDVPGEVASLTQPIPSKPAPFIRQGVVRNDFIDPSTIDDFDVGPIYTPPTRRGLVVTPGEGGGANWGGASYDPTTQILYVNGFGPLTYIVRLEPGNEDNFFFSFPRPIFGPLTGSPYSGFGSAITAYDMNTGDTLWQVPGNSNGTVIGNAASLVSGDLLFYKNSSLTVLQAFDKTTGTLITSIPLGGRPTGAPMTYEWNGQQYVVVALEALDGEMQIVGLSLP